MSTIKGDADFKRVIEFFTKEIKKSLDTVTGLCVLLLTFKDCIQKALDDKEVTITQGGKNEKSRGETDRAKKTITIFDDGLCGPAVLFHELIHYCGGTELDAEAFENSCFTKEECAAPPGAEDFKDFEKEIVEKTVDGKKVRVTDFVIWNPATGEVRINEGTKDKPKRGLSVPIDKEKFKKRALFSRSSKLPAGGHHPFSTEPIKLTIPMDFGSYIVRQKLPSRDIVLFQMSLQKMEESLARIVKARSDREFAKGTREFFETLFSLNQLVAKLDISDRAMEELDLPKLWRMVVKKLSLPC